MSALNLVPNPEVLAVQAGVFLAGVAVIKNLFVKPFLSVRDRRDALTVGSQDHAERALEACEQATRAIEAALLDAASAAKAERQEIRDRAVAQRQEIVSRATVGAKAIVATVETRVKAEVAAEQGKIPSTVAMLTDEVYRAALS